jgi:acyl-CoA thioester hydrolase
VTTTYTTTRRVEFRDTDAAGIAHFSLFFIWMEEVEHEFLRQAGLSVHLEEKGETLSWPRVSARCDFGSTVKFEDVVEIGLRIERMGDKSVTYAFNFSHSGRSVAQGSVTAVCCRLRPGQPPESVAIPAWIREKLAPWAGGGQ